MDQNTLYNCPFCQGTGTTKAFDFEANKDLSDGVYDLNKLVKERGIYAACPEGCHPIN